MKQQQYMWDINQHALKKYEEVYNQALVLTCISMKPSILIPVSSNSSSLSMLSNDMDQVINPIA